MYTKTDPRASLADDKDESAAEHEIAPARYYDLGDEASAVEEDGARVWYARAQNFVLLFARAEGRASFRRTGQPDEYAVLLPDAATRARIEWNGESHDVEGYSVVFVPSGDSTVTLPDGGTAVRLFTNRAADLIERCPAAAPGHVDDLNVAEPTPWPEPGQGPGVRVYSLDVDPREGRFGRIFRSTTFMVNCTYPRSGPRDRSEMSPHKHDHFQQGSLCLEGEYIHHLRWPWGTDANAWREDEHVTCGAPSLAVIPARALHTSEAVGPGTNMLVDIFCPPRMDFAKKEGWVLNAADYPMRED